MISFIRRALLGERRADAVTEALAALDRLTNGLNAVADRINRYQSDAVHEIVPFFQAVSEFQDGSYAVALEQYFAGQPGEEAEDLVQAAAELNALVTNAGRNQSGWNRTEPGQTVTDDHVFPGQSGGCWTFSVADIKANRHGGDPGHYAVVCHQAAQFMNRHISPMFLLIRRLRDADASRRPPARF